MKAARLAAVATLIIASAMTGTAVAQNQNQPPQQGASPGWGPWGMMGNGPGYGFMGPGMMGYGGMGYGGMGPWMMMRGNGSWGAMCNTMSSYIEGRLRFIKAALQITDAQESLWKSYAAAARDNAKTMTGRCTTMMGRRASQTKLPDRLDQNEQLMAAQLDTMRAMDKTLKPLYAELSDSQKKAADQLFWGPMGMM